MRYIIILIALIFVGCAPLTPLDDLYLQSLICNTAGEDCTKINRKIAHRERRLANRTNPCPNGQIIYKDRHGESCVNGKAMMDAMNSRLRW